MNARNERFHELQEHPYQTSVLAVWGLTYWFAVLLKPDLVANVGVGVSAASMVLMGAIVLGNLFLDSRVLWALLGLFMTSGIVSSWVGFTRWNVPYSSGVAALSMALLNAVMAVVVFATVIQD